MLTAIRAPLTEMHLSKEFWALLAIRAVFWVIILSVPFAAHRANAQDAPAPFHVAASDVGDVLDNAVGGLRPGARVIDKFDLTASYLADTDGPLSGWSAFADLQWTDAVDFNGVLVGTMQGISNIDAPSGVRLLDAWMARDWGGIGGIKAGIVDLNSEFDVQATGALFLNPSHGIGPDFSQSGENGPSIFPSTGLGVVAWWLPGGHWQAKAGLFEGIAGDPAHPGRESIALTAREGVLAVLELRNHVTEHFVVGAGAWAYTAAFDTFDGGRSHANSGFYVIADGKLIAVDGHDDQGLSGWLRAGFANAAINPVQAYVGGGIVYTGIFADGDQAGLAAGSVALGGPVRDAAARAGQPLGSGETTLEATYSVPVTGWLTLQPDIQYVIAPGADPSLDDALVIGTRATLTWN
ncbi:MAG TPA: carbohydrate porin [Rhizomicrobium sp.]|jgi:porin|nr:carbohydrate porin [Rhizomicrobium sp.]